MGAVSISRQTAICAVLHTIEMHEAAKEERQVRFAAPCERCPYADSGKCGFGWDNVLAPIWDAAGYRRDLFMR